MAIFLYWASGSQYGKQLPKVPQKGKLPVCFHQSLTGNMSSIPFYKAKKVKFLVHKFKEMLMLNKPAYTGMCF